MERADDTCHLMLHASRKRIAIFSWRIARSPATLISSADFSSALDQTLVSKPNLQWP
jgi:hypothetical protein